MGLANIGDSVFFCLFVFKSLLTIEIKDVLMPGRLRSPQCSSFLQFSWHFLVYLFFQLNVGIFLIDSPNPTAILIVITVLLYISLGKIKMFVMLNLFFQ